MSCMCRYYNILITITKKSICVLHLPYFQPTSDLLVAAVFVHSRTVVRGDPSQLEQIYVWTDSFFYSNHFCKRFKPAQLIAQ